VESGLGNSVAVVTERDGDGRLIGLARAVGDGLYVFIVDVMVAPPRNPEVSGIRLMHTLLGHPRLEQAITRHYCGARCRRVL
jgi:hypothetical protein